MVEKIHRWIVHHDESRVFTVLYIGLAVVLSIWISLFWLVVVVGVHFAFEWLRQRHRGFGPRRTLLESAWELKLDLGLILFALVLSLYLDLVFGLVGLGAAARLAPAASRFLVWKQVLRGVLLSLDDAVQVGRAVVASRRRRRGGEDGVDEEEFAEEPAEETPAVARWGSWAGEWGLGDRLAVGFGLLCLALLVGAPLLPHHDVDSVLETLSEELAAFPGDA